MDRGAVPGRQEGDPPESVLWKIRVSLIQRAEVTCGGQAREAFVIDLGMTGVFVEWPEQVAVGEGVGIRFRLPGNEIPIEAGCRVAWWHPADAPLESMTLPAGMGLEFAELADADRHRIRDYVSEHCRRHPRARQFARPWPTTGGGAEAPTPRRSDGR